MLTIILELLVQLLCQRYPKIHLALVRRRRKSRISRRRRYCPQIRPLSIR